MKKEVVVTIVRQPLEQCAAFVVATQLSRKESVALANYYFEHIPMTVDVCCPGGTVDPVGSPPIIALRHVIPAVKGANSADVRRIIPLSLFARIVCDYIPPSLDAAHRPIQPKILQVRVLTPRRSRGCR